MADSTQAESPLATKVAATEWDSDRAVNSAKPAMAADEPVTEILSEAEYDRIEAQTDGEQEELIEPQSRRLEQGDLQWQRAEFLLKIVADVMNHTSKEYVENEDYWAKWNNEAKILSIVRKADQNLIVQAQLVQEPERWNISLANVRAEDWQDFAHRQQVRYQNERDYYRELYEYFAPNQQSSPSEQCDRAVAKEVWKWALDQGLSEAEAAKETALTVMHHDYAQEMSQRTDESVALEYVNQIAREAIVQWQNAQIEVHEHELG